MDELGRQGEGERGGEEGEKRGEKTEVSRRSQVGKERGVRERDEEVR